MIVPGSYQTFSGAGSPPVVEPPLPPEVLGEGVEDLGASSSTVLAALAFLTGAGHSST